MSLFAELKRRNVIRVGIAYVITAWLVAQVLELVLESFGTPDWVMKTILVLMACGLVFVLIFAWAFEMTPEGLKRERDVDRGRSITQQTGRKLDRVIIGILALAVVYLLVDKLLLHKAVEPVAKPETVVQREDAPAGPEGPSVAVLPFVNMSGDQENEYFSDGLTETLLHMLAQIPDLRVAARTSSFAFKGQNKAIEEIAQTLGVAHILEGSVQKAQDRVRVTAQLIRADDGFHVWSQSYTRPLEDIFAIQDEIATDVAGALGSSLLGASAAPIASVATHDLSAYDSYLKGLEQQAIYSYGSLATAENHFKQALAGDPAFTDARLALVRNYILKNGTGLIKEDETRAAIEPLIRQVREADPGNRLARALELTMEMQIFNPGRGAEKIGAMVDEMRELLFYVPTETYSRERVAGMLNGFFKKPDEAIEVLQAGLLIDPLAAGLHQTLGDIYLGLRRLDDAFASTRRAVELAPDNPNGYFLLGMIEKNRNDLPAALEWMRRANEVDPQDHEIAYEIADDLYELKLAEEGDRWYARVQALAPGSAVARAAELQRAVSMGERGKALELARRMIADQVENRAGAFGSAIFEFANMMLEDGRAREGYDFLVSVRPEIANYEELPGDFKGMMMQWNSFALMTDFESLEGRRARWQSFVGAIKAKGLPWLTDPDDFAHTWNDVMLGDYQVAADRFLEQRLSLPMATNLLRHQRRFAPLFNVIYEEPRVAARLAELDREFEQLREDVREMLQRPEWN